MSIIAERAFSVQFGVHHLKGDVMTGAAAGPARLVILHGAGLGTRERFKPLRACLAERSINSLAFDFIGHGETGGSLSESSLKSRVEQACAVIESLGVTQPFTLLGSSMGAYAAVKLLEIYPIENLILFVPGMYHTAAYPIPFGEEFSKIIRQPASWVGSDAWDILEKFHGRLLLVTAGQDDVIPEDVIQRIYNSATRASSRAHYIVRDSPHLMIHHLSKDPREFEKVSGLILEQFEKSSP